MCSMKQIGKVFEESWKFEWKIDDFFSFSKNDDLYRSPEIELCNSVWCFKINPRFKRNGKEYVSLFLFRVYGERPMTIEFKFGIKNVNNAIVNEMKTNWTPNNEDWGWKEFISRSDLQRNQSEMVPLGTLTIIWSVKVEDNEPIPAAGFYKLATDFKDMFSSKKNTDITIIVKDETFSAHKFCLAARSPVLAAMLENEMIEKNTGLVSIPDCDPEAFKIFLLYLYFGDVNCTQCDVFHLYKIADKYNVSELKLKCVDFMIRSLCAENFFKTYALGHFFNEDKLLTSVQSYFEGNFEKIVSSDDWVKFFLDNCDLANKLLKTMAPKVKIEK